MKPQSMTHDLREIVMRALLMVGGERYLARVAEEHPALFIQLLSRLIPATAQLQASGPVEITVRWGDTSGSARAALPEPVPDATVVEALPLAREVETLL